MDYLTAIEVKSKEAAEQALEELIQQAQKEIPLSYEEARTMQLKNLGYFLGYLNDSARMRAMELYPEAEHPIFGRQFDLPPEICFNAGMAIARAKEEGAIDPILAGRRVIEEYNQR